MLGSFILAIFLFAASFGLFGGSSQAAAPSRVPAPAAAPAALAGAPNAEPAKVQQPHASGWQDIAPFPTVTIDFTPGPTSLKLKRASAAAYPPNGKVYLFGGRHGADGEDINMRTIWEHTPGTPGSWVAKNALLDSSQPGSRWTANMAVAVLTDTNGPRIYAIGGNSIDSVPTSTVRIYNPVADSISLLTTDPWPANPARIPGGYAVYNNKLYIFGGFSAIGTGNVFNDTWVFDPVAAAGTRWTQLTNANLSVARGYIAGATLDGKIYAIGGDIWDRPNRNLIPVVNVERLDPSLPSPTWTSVASLPVARGDHSAWAYDTGTGYEISGSIVVAGGTYPVPDNQAFTYKGATNSWATFPTFLHATRNYGAAQLGGFLYALGGYDYSNNIPNGANYQLHHLQHYWCFPCAGHSPRERLAVRRLHRQPHPSFPIHPVRPDLHYRQGFV
jgi:hypothetical protein